MYEIWLGGAAKLAKEAGGGVLHALKFAGLYLLDGLSIQWVIWLVQKVGMEQQDNSSNERMQVLYNIADAINKIGFGLVIYSLAIKRHLIVTPI